MKYDPMKEYALAYELFTNKNITFPHGSAILFSRKFVIDIMKDVSSFDQFCESKADDVAFGLWMNKMNISLEEFRSKRFQINWPGDSLLHQLLRYSRVGFLFSKRCPSLWSINGLSPKPPKYTNGLAAIHFHNMDMSLCQKVARKIKKNPLLKIYNEENGDSRFCYF